MKEISFNDGIASRGINSMLLLFDQTEAVLTEFVGSNIKGLAVVLSKNYNKNGKWSNTTYTIRIPDNVVAYKWSQDWENGTYLVSEDWDGAYNEFIEKTEFPCDFATFERFVYFRLAKSAKVFNETKEDLDGIGKDSLDSIKELQNIKMMIEKEIIAKELEEEKAIIAQETEDRLAKISEISKKLKGKMTLEELKDLMSECE